MIQKNQNEELGPTICSHFKSIKVHVKILEEPHAKIFCSMETGAKELSIQWI